MGKGEDFYRSFPRAGRYAGPASATRGLLRESRTVPAAFPYSERHLQCAWYDPKWRPAVLCSSDAEPIRVEHPGSWNLEAGPDFLDAVLVVGEEKRRLRGDVEVHVHPQDWRQHRHDEDPAYRRVIAHVTYFAGAPGSPPIPPGVTQIPLRSALLAMTDFSFDNIDVTAYPYSAVEIDRPPCFEALAGWEPEDRAAFLEAAGEERLRTKAARLADEIRDRGEEQVFFEEFLAALGYKRNQAPCRALARSVPLESLRALATQRPLTGYGILLGAGGLLPASPSPRWDAETRAFVRALWDHWWKVSARFERRVLSPDEWALSGLRPQNHPRRRLAAAATLFCRRDALWPALRELDTADAREWFRRAGKTLADGAAIDYWNRRLTLSGRLHAGSIALLGSTRIAAVLSNVVIPMLAAADRPVAGLLAELPAEQDNALIRRTAHTLFGRDHNPLLYARGLRQQGLLQVFHDFCLNDRSRCAACALPAALAASREDWGQPRPVARPPVEQGGRCQRGRAELPAQRQQHAGRHG